MDDRFKPWFYAGPYVPSGVIYGFSDDLTYCVWLIPGFNPNPSINQIDIYHE